ncbi:MAG: BrnA antitoxin family protein [Leptospiraceae bacterium]|nr:BrnA antitoxin family protein [Leptospiraceae bacterium]
MLLRTPFFCLTKLKKQITIRIDENTIQYFKKVAGDTGISYQNLINLCLQDCAANHKKLELKWG